MAENDYSDPFSSPPSSQPTSPEPEPQSPSPCNLITRLSPQRPINSFLMNFLPHVPTYLYSKLDILFYLYADESLDMTVFELAVMELIKDFSAALEEFKKLLPKAASPSSSFNDKVRAGLYDDTNNYILWLKDLKAFKKGALNFAEFKEKVEPHFANMKEMWKEFNSNFADVYIERSKNCATSGVTELDSQRSNAE